eukprot:scaffold360605_cov45-Prasinocladus_malaysianus.AAC.1
METITRQEPIVNGTFKRPVLRSGLRSSNSTCDILLIMGTISPSSMGAQAPLALCLPSLQAARTWLGTHMTPQARNSF